MYALCIQLDIRETQEAAIQLFKSKGYKQWGKNPNYASSRRKKNSRVYIFIKTFSEIHSCN